MSIYLKGSSGACVDCSADDPCTTTISVTDGPIDSATGSYGAYVARLRDLSSGTQLIVTLLKNSSTNLWKMVAISSDGTNYTLGAEYSLGIFAGFYRVVRTSHSGNTFALITTGSPYTVTLFSVNTSTLEITATSSAINSPYTIYDMCFLEDDEVLFTNIVNSLGTTTIYYWLGTVTGGGTGMTFGTALTDTQAATSGTVYAGIERVGTDQAMVFYSFPNTTWYVQWRGLDNTTSLALGGSGTVASSATQLLAFSLLSGRADSGDSYAIMGYSDVSSVGSFFHTTYGSLGTVYTATDFARLTCNSSTLATGLNGSDVYPISISGSTLSAGTGVAASGTTDYLCGINSTTTLRVYRSGSYARAEILT